MAQYAPLRDAFNDFTRLLIDKQEWDARREKENQRETRDNMILQSQLEDAALRRESMKRQAMRDREAMREIEVNIFDVVPNNEYSHRKVFGSPDGAVRFATLMGGSQIDQATGRVLDDNGQPIRLAKGLASDRMASAFGAVSHLFDPEEMIGENLTVINGKLSGLEKELKSVPTTDVARRKQLMEQINEAKTLQTQHKGMMEPDKLLPWYKQRQAQVENLISKVAASGDPQVLQALQASATRMQQDYLQVQQRVLVNEQKRYDIQARREDKALEIQTRKELKKMELDAKLEEAKEKNKGSEKYQQYVAVQRDPQGNVIKRGKIVNVPKAEGSFSVEEIDPNLKESEGWGLMAVEEQARADRKEVKLDSAKIMGALKYNFELESQNAMEGRVLPDANVPRLAATQRIMTDYLDKAPNEAVAARQAMDEVLYAELDLINNAKIAMEKHDITEPDEIAAFMQEFATKSNFFSTYRYIPNLAHEKSLRALLGQK